MKKLIIIPALLLCIISLCACSAEEISIQSGNYYLGNSDSYIKISNFDPDGESSDPDDVDAFLGTCEVQFFNYDFSELNSTYNTDLSKQFSDNSYTFEFIKTESGSGAGEYYICTGVLNSYRSIPDGVSVDDTWYDYILYLTIQYVPEDNMLIIIGSEEERFVLKEE